MAATVISEGDVMRLGDGEDHPELLYIRQAMVLILLLLAIVAVTLSKYGSQVHKMLETSWWFVGTLFAAFLLIFGTIELVHAKNQGSAWYIVRAVELAEISLYLLMAAGFGLASTKWGSARLNVLRSPFWFATIVLSVLWLVSSLVDMVNSRHPMLVTIVSMCAALLIAMLMVADFCVAYCQGQTIPGNGDYFSITTGAAV